MARKPVSYFAGSVVIGTVIGALAGLLAAPMSGAAARGELQRQAKSLTGRLPDGERLRGRFVEWRTRSRGAWGRVPAAVLRRKRPTDLPDDAAPVPAEDDA